MTVAAAASIALSSGPARTGELMEAFGAHRIERAEGKNSYVLHLSADGGTGFIAVRCLADERAITVQLGSPNRSNGIEARQTITIWSDKTPATDVVVAGDPTGAFGIAVMNESAGVEADAAFMTLFEAVISAEQHIAYKVGAQEVTLDATNLQTARARFGALCAQPVK